MLLSKQQTVTKSMGLRCNLIHAFQTLFKYQSVGNNFIIFDLLSYSFCEIVFFVQQTSVWPLFIQTLCDRSCGVGSDGVLIVTHGINGNVIILMFNADGTRGQYCLNGLRCVVDLLVNKKQITVPSSIDMWDTKTPCFYNSDGTIITKTAGYKVFDEQVFYIDDAPRLGYLVWVGNWHFVIQDCVTSEWLEHNISSILKIADLPEQTNIEFYWQITKTCYRALVYEAGVGQTQACSSGVVAITALLIHSKQLQQKQEIDITMPGGIIHAWEEKKNICLKTKAHFLFDAYLDDSFTNILQL